MSENKYKTVISIDCMGGDLGDIVSEEIYLALPKYPKKNGVKLRNILRTEESSELNPFKKLENLKIWNFVLL